MANVVLLAGLHKTGTTSVQRACVANRESLQGYVFPVVQTPSGPSANHSWWMTLSFRERPDPAETKARKLDLQFLQQQGRAGLKRALQAGPRVLLVAEAVSTFSLDELEEMRRWFEDQEAGLQVFCSVRHLNTWVASAVAQYVTGGRRMTIDRAIATLREQGLVRWRIENLRTVFPDCRFYSYERATSFPGGPASFFLSHLGIHVPSAPRANERASDTAVRAASAQNAIGAQASTPKMHGPKFQLTAAEMEPLRHLIEGENSWLEKNLGTEFSFDPVA